MKLVLRIAFCLCLIATSTWCFSSIEDRLYQVETQLDIVRKDNAFLKTEISDLKYEDGINKKTIGQLVQENKSIREELADVKRERQVDHEEIKKLNSQVEGLMVELEGAVLAIDELKRKIQEVESCGCGSTSTSEPVTLNPEAEFIDIGVNQARIAIFNDLDLLVVGLDVNKVYNLRTRELVRTFGPGIPAVFKQNQLILAPSDGPIAIWNVESGELISNLKGDYKYWINSIEFNKDRSLMLTGGNDDTLRLWDMIELRQVREYRGHTSWVLSAVFNEARSQVISGSVDKTIRVWNMNDGSLIKTFTNPWNGINKLLLDEETGRLFSACTVGTIKEWNIETGTELRTITAHSSGIYDMLFSEDGKRLVSSSADKSIIIWDKESGQEIRQLNHTGRVYYLARNPLNGQLLSTTNDATLIFWPVRP